MIDAEIAGHEPRFDTAKETQPSHFDTEDMLRIPKVQHSGDIYMSCQEVGVYEGSRGIHSLDHQTLSISLMFDYSLSRMNSLVLGRRDQQEL